MAAVQNEEGLQAAGPKTRSAKTPKEDSWLLDLTRWSLWEERPYFMNSTRPKWSLKLTLVLNTRNHSLEGAHEPGPWNEEWGVGRKGRTREKQTFIRQPTVSGPQ